MLSKQKEERPNLREIIPLLLSLQQRIKVFPLESIDEAYRKINKAIMIFLISMKTKQCCYFNLKFNLNSEQKRTARALLHASSG